MKAKGHELSVVVHEIIKGRADFPELVHFWRFLTGVVYSLDQYWKMSSCYYSFMKNSDEQEYIQETDNVLTSILNNKPPTASWLRGFYYNAALMRLDAAYERFFKAYLGKQKLDSPNMYMEIRSKFSSIFPKKEYEESNFGKMRREVNSLKHFVGGADPTEREQPEVLQRALIELVAFLKDPIVIKELNKFSGKGIIAGRK
jgi:hypothetical protein